VVGRKALFICLIITVFLLAGCTGGKDTGNSKSGGGEGPGNTYDNVTVTSAEHFPAAAGLYKRFEGPKEEWEETMGKPGEFDGKQVIPIHINRLNISEDETIEGGEVELREFTNFYVVGQEVLFVGSRAKIDDQVNDETIPVPSVIFKTGLKKGESWFYELFYTPGRVKVTVEDFATITTKAGTFSGTAKIKIEYNYLDDEGREIHATAYEWYAPGYGKVKLQGDGEIGTGEVVEVKKGG
jgi:hypothetical protein